MILVSKVRELPCDVFDRQCAEVSDYLLSQGLGNLAEASARADGDFAKNISLMGWGFVEDATAAETAEVVQDGAAPTADAKIMACSGPLSSRLHEAWPGSRQAYRMDAALAEVLCATPLEDLPSEVLARVPYACFYVDAEVVGEPAETPTDRLVYRGFYVLNSGSGLDFYVLKDFGLLESTTGRFPYRMHHFASVPFDATSIEGVMEGNNNEAQALALWQKKGVLHLSPVEYTAALAEARARDADATTRAARASALRKMVSMVLYIASEEADVVRVYSPSAARYNPKKRLSGCTVSDVGFRVGRELGQAQRFGTAAGTGTGSSKRTHVRRAHWHSYWTGSGEDRRLVARWVSPIVVNAGKSPKITVVHEAKRTPDAEEKQARAGAKASWERTRSDGRSR